MNQLQVVVECSSMLISTQFFRFSKAVEQFYYALLFSSEDYAGTDPWNSWAEIGFHIAVKSAPPAAGNNDLLTVDTRPGRTFEVTAVSNNGRALARLSETLQAIERARSALPTGSEEARLKALLDNPGVESHLLRPLRESLKRHSVPNDEAESIWSMIKRGLSALTNWQIQSVKIAAS
jgi:hypothetical protein